MNSFNPMQRFGSPVDQRPSPMRPRQPVRPRANPPPQRAPAPARVNPSEKPSNTSGEVKNQLSKVDEGQNSKTGGDKSSGSNEKPLGQTTENDKTSNDANHNANKKSETEANLVQKSMGNAVEESTSQPGKSDSTLQPKGQPPPGTAGTSVSAIGKEGQMDKKSIQSQSRKSKPDNQ
jgi:hypothetical protein